jgi:aspartate carbamoyltransferase catalytic subunit
VRSILSVSDLDRGAIEEVLGAAGLIAAGNYEEPARCGRIVALVFFEESLRTRVGFAAAAARLGIATVAVDAVKHTDSMSVGEDLPDTLRTLGGYVDAILLRHPDPDAPSLAARVAGVPIVNCGNGTDEHPTQALIDLMAIRDARGAIDGVRIALVGDLRYMRTAHSLLLALHRFSDVRIRLISPPELRVPANIAGDAEEVAEFDSRGVDIVYMAGFAPQTPSGEFAPEVRGRYVLTAERAAQLSDDVRILCPLPRVDEIDRAVDALPQAAYFHQAALGLPVRMAILKRVLEL